MEVVRDIITLEIVVSPSHQDVQKMLPDFFKLNPFFKRSLRFSVAQVHDDVDCEIFLSRQKGEGVDENAFWCLYSKGIEDSKCEPLPYAGPFPISNRLFPRCLFSSREVTVSLRVELLQSV